MELSVELRKQEKGRLNGACQRARADSCPAISLLKTKRKVGPNRLSTTASCTLLPPNTHWKTSTEGLAGADREGATPSDRQANTLQALRRGFPVCSILECLGRHGD